MIKKGLIFSILMLIGVTATSAQAKFTDRVLVLPFENTSGKPEFNWVGESFALSLSELLRVPGLNVVSNGERKAVQQRLRIPLTSLPSIATSLKLSRESGATLLITGTYTIVPSQGDLAATVNVTFKIIRVNEGRQIVLVKRAIEPGYGKWVFPGGYVDRGEEIMLAAIREAREEVGLEVRLDHLVDIYSYAGRTPVIIVYAATKVAGELAVDEEGLEAREFELHASPWDEVAFRSTSEALRDYLGAKGPGPRA